MKRRMLWLPAILAILMTFCLVLSAAAAESMFGDWILQSVKNGENVRVYTEADNRPILTLKEDGSAVREFSGQKYTGTWKTADGQLYIRIGDDNVKTSVENGKLVQTEGNQVVTFVRMTAEDPASAAGIAIDESNFPDPYFRDYVRKSCDRDGDGKLSEEEMRTWVFQT